ncbi:MAG: DsbE family thiol:disulfide interchange protein [Betaproteobacteria bacterium]|nr:DsbE family thiol:disulfide interchange protein [Betaproteobacteria bacterium]
MRRLIPFAIFIVLAIFFAVGLQLNPRELPSPLIGKPAPDFRLALLHEPATQLGPADLRGKVWLLNVWASWCGSCREEHEVLLDLSRRNLLPIYGMDYKDSAESALAWLERLGNPYAATLVDADGRVGIDYGVYGVPETYLIDRSGVIRHKHSGPLTVEALEKTILPLAEELLRCFNPQPTSFIDCKPADG